MRLLAAGYRRNVRGWLGVSPIERREPRLATIAIRPDHPLAPHRQPTTQFCKTRPRTELGDENLPLEGVTPFAEDAFQHDDGVSNVLQRRSVTTRQILPSSRHQLSGAPRLIAERRLPIPRAIYRQGAVDDKNIFNDDAHLRSEATILIHLNLFEIAHVAGIDS
jgi:hypothetical protein